MHAIPGVLVTVPCTAIGICRPCGHPTMTQAVNVTLLPAAKYTGLGRFVGVVSSPQSTKFAGSPEMLTHMLAVPVLAMFKVIVTGALVLSDGNITWQLLPVGQFV